MATALHCRAMTTTLDLDPEWGAIDLTEEVEAAFDIKIADSEAEQCWTVGDLYEIVCRHTPDWEAGDGSCSSSMAFYRVRRSISPHERRAVSPRTPLGSLSERPSRFVDNIGKSTGLRVPMTELTGRGKVGAWLICGAVAAFIAALVWTSWQFAGLAAAVMLAGLLLARSDRGKFPEGVETVGDLVRRTAALNAAKLREEGARPVDRWEVLVALCAEYGALPPTQIGPDTFLLRKGMEIATARA